MASNLARAGLVNRSPLDEHPARRRQAQLGEQGAEAGVAAQGNTEQPPAKGFPAV